MKKILKNKYLAGTVFVLILFISGLVFLNYSKQTDAPNQQKAPEKQELPTKDPGPPAQKPALSEPVTNAKARITKKPFGIYITPQTSPVQPEKFSGYHTGTDFETTPGEAGAEVPVYAICTGKIRNKEIVQGYGGVIVQDCTLDDQPVTVLYGHLNIRQSQASSGLEAKAGEEIATLAAANSELSGGERKHLHLGIHKGNQIDYRGYVQNQPELSGWLDIQKYL